MPKVVDGAARRIELASAAARLIARSGVSAATLREVAAEAGMTTGALTHYFADKRELLIVTFRHSLAARESTADECADLVAVVERSLPTTEEARLHWLVTVALCAQAGDDPELLAVQRDAYRGHRARMAQRIRRAGLAKGRQAVVLAEQIIAVADGIALQALFDPDGWPPAHQRARLRTAVDALTGAGHRARQ